jgi:hypothetical protein
MKPCGNGRFCGSCQKVVVDFSDKTLDEIHSYFDACKGEHICGQYQARHTTNTNPWFNILNKIEFALSRIRLQRVALFLITALLFLTGCARRLSGRCAPYHDYTKGGKAEVNSVK